MPLINQVLIEWIPGDLHSLKWLIAKGISQSRAYEYYKSGLFEKHGPGIYSRRNEKLQWIGAIRLLQKELKKNIHISGRTALELHGHGHYLSMGQKQVIYLSSYTQEKIPKWFYNISSDWIIRFNNSILIKGNIVLNQYTNHIGLSVQISSRELAILELINCLDLSYSFETVENYMNGLQTLRPDVVQELLENCTSIKVKRVFLYLAEKLELPFVNELDIARIDLGTGKRQIVIENGQFDYKYQITVPKEGEGNQF